LPKLQEKDLLNEIELFLTRSLTHQVFTETAGISTAIPTVSVNHYVSRYRHISSPKITLFSL